MTQLELDRAIAKVTLAIMTRNRHVVGDILTYLRTQMPLEEVAGVVLISLERLLWFESSLVIWSMENIIPFDIRLEIKRIIAITVYKQLIGKGLVPGKDFSIDANGKVLQKKPCGTIYSL